MSNLKSPFLQSNKGLFKTPSISSKHNNNKLKILNKIHIIQLKNNKDKVRMLRVKTRKAASQEYQNTNIYLSFCKGKIVKVYIKKACSCR
jgi:poly-D-alanine transfer protein DltD